MRDRSRGDLTALHVVVQLAHADAAGATPRTTDTALFITCLLSGFHHLFVICFIHLFTCVSVIMKSNESRSTGSSFFIPVV